MLVADYCEVGESKETSIPNTYYTIDFLILMDFFAEKN